MKKSATERGAGAQVVAGSRRAWLRAGIFVCGPAANGVDDEDDDDDGGGSGGALIVEMLLRKGDGSLPCVYKKKREVVRLLVGKQGA